MAKSLVVCCDGTWNTPDQRSGDASTPTNVTKVALAVSARGAGGREQRTFYHPGVGTRRWERLRGGAFGFGLSRNVRDTYRFLVQNFDPGDALYFFGFSRGAFTARSAAGLVRNCGILRREHLDRVDEAYRLYRSDRKPAHPRGVEATLFRRTYSHEPSIRFIGVWDTVGALGIPINGLSLVDIFNRRYQFHDTDLSGSVADAYQALAIDEKRGPFRPTLWKQQADAPPDQHVEQVWFAGVHCDVGGGYRKHALSDIALLWMVNRATSCGLVFDSDAFTPASGGGTGATPLSLTAVTPNPLTPPQDSRRGIYRLIPPFIRRIGVTDAAHEFAASSAVELYHQMPWYRPAGLVSYLNGEPRIVAVEPPDA